MGSLRLRFLGHISPKKLRRVAAFTAVLLLTLARAGDAQTSAMPSLQALPNHVPQMANGQSARYIGPLSDSQKMRLSIVLPLRNQDALKQLIARLYDPASVDYHKFLSVQEFTDQFGPADSDYQEVVKFATDNGFAVTGQAKNRLVVTVEGTAAQVNTAFHVRMVEYQHPTESRTFFSPDREPSVAVHAQIAHVEGMDNLNLPHAMNVIPDASVPMAAVNGSGPGGSYLGSDMRAVYYGGSELTGVNQTIALIEFGGYLKSDVDLNFSGAGQSYNVPLQNILVGTAVNAVYREDAEQVLDIVQAIGMAPGLSAVEVYIGDPTTAASSAAVLNQIASDNTAKQIGCSWGWIPGSASAINAQEAILEEMAAQGQTFFAASGDAGAYQYSINPYFYPAESQYVTAVGGTHLTTNSAGGSWSSEVAWNSEGDGSGGGISPDAIPIPSWQSGLATSGNGGSNTLRNVPDVAAEGDFDNYVCNLGVCSGNGAGTSFAAPRWAGFMALVNQQAVEAGNAPLGGIGFINAALSQIGTGSNYGNDLHDIQSGNNDTRNQTVWFNAVPSYDLVTGWGSPAGQPLIDDLAGKAIPGFWISSSTGAINVVQGANATATIKVTDAGGFSGNVSLAVTSTLPGGVTASFSPASTSSSSVLTLTASSSAVQGTFPVTITGTSGSITETTTVNVVVHGPTFTLSTATTSLTVNQGASATTTVTVNDLYGFTGNVSLQASGLPTGLTASFSANPTGTTSVLTLTAASSAASWIGAITITGTSGSLTASTQVYVNLVAPGFTLFTAGNISMGQSSTSSTFVDISPVNGFNGNVTLSVSGLPSGATAFFTPNPITTSGYLTVVTSNNATVGNATLTITGKSGSITSTATLTLTVNSPGFTLFGGGSVSLGVGSTATGFVEITDQYGFNGSVTLSASGLPAGITASFATNPATSYSQMTFAASSSATPGTYTVTVTGTAGSITETTTYLLNVGAPTFTVLAPTNETLSQSGSISTYVDVSSQYGFSGNVTFSVSGLPSGVTAAFSTNPTPYSSQLTLTASSAAATGNYTVTITGTSGSISKATTMTLSIVAPGIQISGTNSLTLGIGTSTSGYVYVYGNNGFNGNVTLSLSGLPSGITAAFSPNPVTLTGYSNSSLLTLTASSSVAAGSYTATLTGTSGSVTASTSITIAVAAPNFTISAYTAPTIGQGGSASTSVYVNAVNGFNSPVTLSVSGLPSGVTAGFGTNPTTYSSQLTFSATNAAPTGSYTVTVTGTSGSIVASTSMTIIVAAPSFALDPSPAIYTLNQGGTANGYLYMNGTNGFSGSVTLSASGLPSGVTASFGPNPTTYSSSITFTATGSATPGTATVTITGTSGSITASTTIALTVNAPAFQLTAAPGSINFLPGGSEKTSVFVSPLNGFSGSINFSISGLPAGVTSSWNPSSSAAGSVLTLTASGSAQPGTTTATITGTSGVLTATAQLPITIRATAAATTTTLAITAGGAPVTSTTWGTPITLTGSVTSNGAPVTSGLVNFCDSMASYCGDIHLLGSAQLNNAGKASIQLRAMGGNHSYKAVFAGTAANGASASAAGSLQVTGAYPTMTTLTSAGSVGNYTLNATVTGGGTQAVSGKVSFVDTSNNNAAIASANLVAGTSALTIAQLGTIPVTSSYGSTMAAGDFNGDGITDVATLYSELDAVTISLGNADGTYTRTDLSPQTSSYPLAITTGDFNNDGIADLAVAMQSGSVDILLGNGDGTFNAPVTTTESGINAGRILAGDFNGDGIADLAVSDTYNNRLMILLGKGDGTFTISSSYPATGNSPSLMAAADLNGDELLDIVVGNSDGSLTVLLGNGDGTFSKMPNSPSIGNSVAAIAVLDFNGDGKADLVATSFYSPTISVLQGNGDGSFTAKTSLTTNYYSSALVPIDINRDGKVDLVVTSSESASAGVFMGNGDGTFSQASSVALPGPVSSAVAAQLTSNGYPGLIAMFPGLNGAVALEPYIAQSATASATGVKLDAAGFHPIAASYSGDTNYAASLSLPVAIQGSKSYATITWAAPTAIVYGTALGATQLNATANVPGSFSYSPAVGAILNAGSQTLSVTFTPTDTTNYATTTAAVQLIVNTAPLTVKANNASMTYGGAIPALNGTLTGVVPGDDITAGYTTTATSSSAAGTYPITATLNDPNGKLGNYAVTRTPGTLTIGQATPTITWATPAAIVYGTALGATQLDATASVPGAFVYNPAAGTIPAIGNNTLSVTFTPTDAIDYKSATATVTLSVVQPGPSVTSFSPAIGSAGGAAFTLTVNGAGFTATSVVYWGSSALTTQYASPTQVTAQVPAADIATAGTYAITVQNPAPGGGTSNAEQFEVDTAGSGAAPTFTPVTNTISAGATASYSVTLPSTATNVSAICLNLPAGATCSYSATTGAVSIVTTSTTPTGTYQITVVFHETLPGAAAALVLLPALLWPLSSRRKWKARWLVLLLGSLVLSIAAIGCGGGGSGGSQGGGGGTTQTHQVTSSGTVTLIVR